MMVSVVNQASAQKFEVEKEISRKIWEVDLPLGGAIQPLGDFVQISNRAGLHAKQDWTTGTLSFEWKPLNLPAVSKEEDVKTDENIRLYGDHLVVFLSSQGNTPRFQDGRGGEVTDGVVVKIDAGGGNAWISSSNGEGAMRQLDHKLLPRKEGSPAISTEWHQVSIADDGRSVSVTVDDKRILSVDLPFGSRAGKKWGIYNREPVGPPGPHISHLRSLEFVKQ